jgi:hypothetical protein
VEIMQHNFVKALMSIGHPGESEETAWRFAVAGRRVDDFDCTIITVYPSTPYYDYAVPGETDRAFGFTPSRRPATGSTPTRSILPPPRTIIRATPTADTGRLSTPII